MKKVLMIGAGIGQIFLAKKIKSRGYYLITVTLPGNYPVLSIADKVYYENVFNKEGVLSIARQENIDAVISDQNDLMMPTVAFVAQHLGLPGNSVLQVQQYCDKNTFRDNCDKLKIPVPVHCSVSEVKFPARMRDVPFPWVVKPADAQSSVGVVKVKSEEEYYDAINNALSISKSHTAIVEEFFEGQEVVVEGFVYRGKYYNLGFADRKYFNLGKLFIPSQTLFPSMLSSVVLKKMQLCEEKMASYVNPNFAIVHSEYLYDARRNEFCVVESALRGGGVFISSHLVPAYSNIDINEVLIDVALGDVVEIEDVFSKRNNKAAGYVCFYLPKGKVKSINGIDKLNKMDSVIDSFVDDLYIGAEVTELSHKGQRKGPILLKASDRQELEQKIREVQNMLCVEIQTSNGELKGIKWV